MSTSGCALVFGVATRPGRGDGWCWVGAGIGHTGQVERGTAEDPGRHGGQSDVAGEAAGGVRDLLWILLYQ
jgi:hypothetical protein